MTSRTKTIIFALFFLLSSTVSLGQEEIFRSCFVECVEYQCQDIVDLDCLQHCHGCCTNHTIPHTDTNTNILGGRPMMLGPRNGVPSESTGLQPPLINPTGPNEPQPPVITNWTEGSQSGSDPQAAITNSTSNGSTLPVPPREPHGQDQTTRDPIDSLSKSNAWPTIPDPRAKSKTPMEDHSTRSHTMDEDQPRVPNSVEGLREFTALPILIGSLGGRG